MRVPQGHSSERDLPSFLKSAQTHLQRKLTEELLALGGLKLTGVRLVLPFEFHHPQT